MSDEGSPEPPKTLKAARLAAADAKEAYLIIVYQLFVAVYFYHEGTASRTSDTAQLTGAFVVVFSTLHTLEMSPEERRTALGLLTFLFETKQHKVFRMHADSHDMCKLVSPVLEKLRAS